MKKAVITVSLLLGLAAAAWADHEARVTPVVRAVRTASPAVVNISTEIVERGRSPFEVTVDNIRSAVPRIKTTVITQVNRLNLDHLSALYEILCDLGVEKWQIQLAVPTGRVVNSRKPLILAPPDLDRLTAFIVEAQESGNGPHIDTSDTIGYYTEREVALRHRVTGQGIWLGCQAGIRSVAITYDGKVRGCSILPPEFDAGDLHCETLEAIWNGDARFGFSTAFDPAKLQGECRNCRYGAICRAGCTSMAYYTTGTIYYKPYCITGQGMIREARGAEEPPVGLAMR